MNSAPRPWGPRPSGPPVPAFPRTSGCLIASMVIVALIGLALTATIGSSTVLGVTGILIVVGAAAFFVNLWVIRPTRAGHVMRQSRQQLQDWYESRPQMAIAGAQDPLVAARDLTWSQGGGAFLGITPDYREWTTAAADQAVLVLGPPRSGKTASIIVPSILNAAGPVVSTATRRDVMAATYRPRSRYGRVWLFEPTGEEAPPEGVLSMQWTPVWGARNWDAARSIADAMVHAAAIITTSSSTGSENAYWTESAKSLFAPMLHAAALSGKTMDDVRRWVLYEDYEAPRDLLVTHGARLAADELDRVCQTEQRERGSVVNATSSVVRAYGSQTVLDHSERPNFDAERFVRSADTLYIVAPATEQEMLAPLVAGLLEEIRLAAYRNAKAPADGGGRRPPMLWALDEVATVAPLRMLPAIVTDGGAHGLQLMACFQDLSQASLRWGKAAEVFLTQFGTKVVFPGIGDRKTLDALSTMVGDWDRHYAVTTTSRGQSTGLGLIPERTNSYGSSTSYSTHREALFTPGEVANIPQGTALVVQSGRWRLVEHTPYFHALPWTAVLASAPATAVPRGGPDVLVPGGPAEPPAPGDASPGEPPPGGDPPNGDSPKSG